MSTYSLTATIATTTGTVDVSRNGLETTEGDVVRLDVTDGFATAGSVYLTQAQAEELAVAILTAAGLTATPTSSGMGGLARSYQAPADTALRALQDATDTARTAGAHPGLILGRVANGLTGQTNGYVERAATEAMLAAFTVVAATPVEDLKAAEQARDRWAEAQRQAAARAKADGWES